MGYCCRFVWMLGLLGLLVVRCRCSCEVSLRLWLILRWLLIWLVKLG